MNLEPPNFSNEPDLLVVVAGPADSRLVEFARQARVERSQLRHLLKLLDRDLARAATVEERNGLWLERNQYERELSLLTCDSVINRVLDRAWVDGGSAPTTPPPAIHEALLPVASSLSELSPFQASGPPPPSEELTTLARTSYKPIRTTSMPSAARWWNEQIDQFLPWYAENRSRRGLAPSTEYHWRRDLTNWREKCLRVGVEPPGSAGTVTSEQIRAVKDSGLWRGTTLKPTLCALRLFCAWGKNPTADKASVWRLPDASEDRRHWLTESQTNALLEAATGRLRRRVALQAWNGLREEGVRFLRAKHLDLALPTPTLYVFEKGKGRTVDVLPTTRAILLEWAENAAPEDRAYEVEHAVADGELAALGREVGVPFRVAGHVLRRSFARNAIHAGVPVATVRRILGHATDQMTYWYAGVERERDQAELARFEAHMARARSNPETTDPGDSEEEA